MRIKKNHEEEIFLRLRRARFREKRRHIARLAGCPSYSFLVGTLFAAMRRNLQDTLITSAKLRG